MKLRVTRKGHRRGKIDYGVGDVFEGTERELAAFGDRLEVVEDEQLTDTPPEYIAKPGGWYEFADGVKVRGKADLEAELARRSKE